MATIKVIYNSSVRRFTIPTSTTWFEFERKIRSLFSIQIFTPITVAYKDEDGDLVTISSDLELEEILSNASDQTLIFTLSTNEDDNKNSWVLEGHSMEPYRIVQENNLNGEEPLPDQNPGEITKEPTIETETKPKSVTFHLHTTVTDETHEPSFGPTITNDKNEETQNRNESSDAPSTSSSSSAKSQVGINSSASTPEEAKNPKKGPETTEETDPNNLWEVLKNFLEYEDTPHRETPPENLGESSSNVNPRLVRISPPHHSRQTYDPRILGFDNPRCGRSFTFSRPTQNPYIARAANTRPYCGCCSNQCTYSANYCSCTTDSQRHPHQYNYQFSPRPFSNCRDQFHPLFKFIFRAVATIMFFSVIITVVKTAFFILCLLFPIAFFIIPIVFFVKVHNRLYVRREHFGRPFFRSRNPIFSYDAQFLRRRHGGMF